MKVYKNCESEIANATLKGLSQAELIIIGLDVSLKEYLMIRLPGLKRHLDQCDVDYVGREPVGNGYDVMLICPNSYVKDILWGDEACDPIILESERFFREQVTINYKIDPALDDRQFYKSMKWMKLRYRALIKYGRKCMACNRGVPDVVLHVDHIKPRSKFPDLQLDINNLQILCADCNLAKSNTDQTDWRVR